jgi:hypothetical protein
MSPPEIVEGTPRETGADLVIKLLYPAIRQVAEAGASTEDLVRLHCGMCAALFSSLVHLVGQEPTADLLASWAAWVKETTVWDRKLND